MSKEALDKLESRVMDAVQLLGSLQGENKTLKEEIEQLKRSIEEIKGENNYKSKLIKQFKSDRLKIQSRVDKIMEKVIALGEPS
ncbi:MAG: cell division protein ZapB [Acidobacteriota bacterium]|nr:cell division protein ZapB [Acidobacteriota bacterium]